MLYTDSRLIDVQEGDPYTDIEGTQYPSNYPKNEIATLVVVTETSRPSDVTNIVSGYTIELVNGVPTQVWHSTPRPTSQQRSSAKVASGFSALVQRRVRALERKGDKVGALLLLKEHGE